MKCAVDLDKYPGSVEPPIYPCDWRDAEGKVWHLPCVFVDTELGIMRHRRTDKNGNQVLTEDGLDFIIDLTYAPAPLTCIPMRRKVMPEFNHSRGDAERTPCPECAVEIVQRALMELGVAGGREGGLSDLADKLAPKLLFLRDAESDKAWAAGHESGKKQMEEQLAEATERGYKTGVADERAKTPHQDSAVTCSVEVLRAAVAVVTMDDATLPDPLVEAARKYLTDLFEGKP